MAHGGGGWEKKGRLMSITSGVGKNRKEKRLMTGENHKSGHLILGTKRRQAQGGK